MTKNRCPTQTTDGSMWYAVNPYSDKVYLTFQTTTTKKKNKYSFFLPN